MSLEAGQLEYPSDPSWKPKPTLGGGYYTRPEVWEAERERVFADEWFCVGREEEIPETGNYLVRDVAGEQVLITRGKDRRLRAFFNVCTHRGTRLCDPGPGHAKSNVIKCPYHAWTFTMEGECVGTPNVHEEEGFDKSTVPLWGMHLETWQGFVWVHMGKDPLPLKEAWERENFASTPEQFERYHMDELRIGHTIVYEVKANWKIILENFNECLHCPGVHPELVQMVPLYRKGRVEETGEWWGASLVDGAVTLTPTGQTNRPLLPGLDERDIGAYYGHNVFPNMLFNYHSDCVMTYRLEPRAPDHTAIVSEYLFRPETIAAPDFDPSDIVEFWDLVSRQDWEVCERAQTGVRSRAYAGGGVYPYNDRWLYELNRQYLRKMGEA